MLGLGIGVTRLVAPPLFVDPLIECPDCVLAFVVISNDVFWLMGTVAAIDDNLVNNKLTLVDDFELGIFDGDDSRGISFVSPPW